MGIFEFKIAFNSKRVHFSQKMPRSWKCFPCQVNLIIFSCKKSGILFNFATFLFQTNYLPFGKIKYFRFFVPNTVRNRFHLDSIGNSLSRVYVTFLCIIVIKTALWFTSPTPTNSFLFWSDLSTQCVVLFQYFLKKL